METFGPWRWRERSAQSKLPHEPFPRQSAQLSRSTRRRDCVLLHIGRHWPGASERGSLLPPDRFNPIRENQRGRQVEPFGVLCKMDVGVAAFSIKEQRSTRRPGWLSSHLR
jgi:hypothetical protein